MIRGFLFHYMVKAFSKRLCIEIAKAILTGIVLCYGLSFAAQQHWSLDLLRHFLLQYALIAALLTIAFLVMRQWMALMIALALLGTVSYEIYVSTPQSGPAPATQERRVVIAQYNRFFGNPEFEAFYNWVRNGSGQNVDIVLIQEGYNSFQKFALLEDVFPYRYPANGAQQFNEVVVLSKKPITVEPLRLQAETFHTIASRVSVTDEGATPLVIYSLHTKSPTNATRFHRRNDELMVLADVILQDSSPYIVASGDWNVTPYSPYFRTFRKISGLTNRYFGHLPPPTWPEFAPAYLAQLPIDHILTSPNMTIISKKRGPAMGSDHFPIIAEIAY